MTTVVNFYAGPGAGKSTLSAYGYYLAKKAGRNVELVREYVKDWVWEGRNIGQFDQFYFQAKHIRHESLLFDKVETIFSDSPVLLPVMYARMYSPSIAPSVEAAATGYYDAMTKAGHTHKHLFLERRKEYNPQGRMQTEAEARELDDVTLSLLYEFGLDYDIIPADEWDLERWLRAEELI